MIPTLPPFPGMHPLVVHLPIGLLAVVPLFLFMGLLSRKQRACFCLAALVLMLLGAAGTWVAVASGQAAFRVAAANATVLPVVLRHEDFGENTRLIFTLLALLYAGVLAAGTVQQKRGKPFSPRTVFLVQVAFLLVYLAGVLVLVKTGDLGAHLVHQYGLRALLGTLH